MNSTISAVFNPRLLIIDSDRAVHDDIRKVLTLRAHAAELDVIEAELFGGSVAPIVHLGFEIDSAYCAQKGLEQIEYALTEGCPYQVAFVDAQTPTIWDGVGIIERLWQADPALQVVICTTYSNYQWESIATQLPFSDQFLILKKPFDPIEVAQIAQALSSKWRLQRELQMQLHSLDRQVQQRTAELRDANERLQSEIAQRKHIELELRLTQKLEAVGQLAAGIAHEINTPIQYIGDSVHFLKSAFEDLQTLIDRCLEGCEVLAQQPGCAKWAIAIKEAEESADLDYLRENAPSAFTRTLEGISHVTSIVRAMKEFAHPDQREKSLSDLNKAILTTLIVARNEYKYIADVETVLGELPPVLCYLNDLNQVFLNLVINAAHAISEVTEEGARRGKITITTQLDGDWVEIAIADTGCGIPEAIRDRVYDPFFTTKAVGKGTGQGLAIARSIVVDKHQGALYFDSAPEQGTTFYIRLPVG